MYKGSLGRHILVEFYECSPEVLNDVTLIEKSMVEAARKAEATVINSTFHHFSPYGVSGVVVIQESHLAIHTWPEYGFASVDVFTCGDLVDPWIAFDYLKEAFESMHASPMELKRGQVNQLEKNDHFDDLQVQRDQVEAKIKPTFKRNVWFTDKNENVALSLRHDGELLFRKQTPFQKVEIYNTYEYGKMLACDNMVMTTEKDEYVYHEMISHIPLILDENIKNVLVIGGGDGGTVREILKHKQVEKVTMVEIDEEVINASKEFLPSLSTAFDNPKLNLIIGDGIKHIIEAGDATYDLIIVDSTDPVGPAEGLFSEEFYRHTYRVLSEKGSLITQSESPRFNKTVFVEINRLFKKIFGEASVHPYCFYISTYPTGMWSFTYSTKSDIHPVKNFKQEKAESFCSSFDLNYYNPEIHISSFALPNFVKKMLNEG